MLERIINITPGSDYNHSAKNPKLGKKFSLYAAFQSDTSADSIHISPATAFLANIRWKLKKFANDQERINLVFEFDGFEFLTHFSVRELIQIRRIEYDVKKSMENLGNLVKVSSRISAPLNEFMELDVVVEHMRYLSEFYTRLLKSGLRIPSVVSDTTMLGNMAVDIKNELSDEFSYINSCLLHFVEKYSSQRIAVPAKSGTEETELIIKSVNLG